jgi:uncharacterized protein (TIGR03435 family)
MRFSPLLIGLLVIGFALGSASQEQAPASSTEKLKVYEVVSIRPSKQGTLSGTQALPNGFRDINITLDTLVKDAYATYNEGQVMGMPSWAKSEPYDVEAKVDADTADAWKSLSDKERWKQEQPMLQSALAERCKLKVHFETKELPVYDLVIDKGGLKMKEATPDEKSMEHVRNGSFTVRAMPIENLVVALPADGRLIVDKTGLGDKRFDFDLQWTPDNHRMDADSGPSLFTALEEQLGLKLLSSKAPEKVLVIDHMEKPSPN